MVCIALVKTDMEDGSSEDVYLRAKVQEVIENEVSIITSGATCVPLIGTYTVHVVVTVLQIFSRHV